MQLEVASGQWPASDILSSEWLHRAVGNLKTWFPRVELFKYLIAHAPFVTSKIAEKGLVSGHKGNGHFHVTVGCS